MSNTKLGVDVVRAYNLLPKDGEGSSSAFVELNFDGQLLRTTVKEKDLNPVWNENFYFHISDPSDLPKLTLDAFVYNSVKATSSKTRSLLGKIILAGDKFVHSSDADVSYYPLENRGIFSRVRGSLGLKVYVTDHDPSINSFGTPIAAVVESLENTNQILVHGSSTQGDSNDATNTSSNAGVETRHTLHRLPNPSHDDNQLQGHPPADAEVSSKYEADDFALRETSPFLGGGRVVDGRLIGGNKTESIYNLVEQEDFLYIRVVKARNLPSMSTNGSLDPFVEVSIGNYKGATKCFENQKNPEWNEVFSFSKDGIRASVLEIVIKDNDRTKEDDFVGSVIFDTNAVAKRIPPVSPQDPEWYSLGEKRGKKKIEGELMLAVWFGTQEDKAFSEARRSDVANPVDSSSDSICSNVYHAPRLWYVRVNVIQAKNLFAADKNGILEAFVKIKIGNQVLKTKTAQVRSYEPYWNEVLLFVTAEPFEDDHLLVTVATRIGYGPDGIVVSGGVMIPLRSVHRRVDDSEFPSRWFKLEKPLVDDHEDVVHHDQLKKEDSSSSIHLGICLEGGYHVLDESPNYSSDLRPTAEQLWRPSIGVLELGILDARGLLPAKTRDGKGTSDTYCVAKYGHKWVRTRTIVGDLCPKYNEAYSWEVYDPATVLTVGVFDNSHLIEVHNSNDDKGNRDLKIGKVRIRISTLEAGRICTHSYPLLVLHPSGIKKMGELHLAIRFSCTSYVNRLCMYSQPLLPKMHYVKPITVMQFDMLRHMAVNIIAARLCQAEPPLRKEVVEYMSDVDSHMWSMRRSKANFFRVMSVLSGLFDLVKWFGDVCMWENPITTVLVHVFFLMLLCFPQLVLPTTFLYLFLIGVLNFRFRPDYPLSMNTKISFADLVHTDELDEEFDTFPTSKSQEVVRMRYDRIRSLGGRVQAVVDDVATHGERILALLSWRDAQATAIFLTSFLVAALVLYVTPFQVVAALAGLFIMRPPRFRHKLPLGPVNFFLRLPSRTESML